MEPNNSRWSRELGDWHQTAAEPFPRSVAHQQLIVEELKKALAYYEDAYPNADGDWRNGILRRLTKVSFDAGDFVKAKSYAIKFLTQSDPEEDGSPDGEAVHDGNLILGRVALREGDVEQAKRRLLEAGKSSGSPVLGSFGPNMALAKELLEKGESEVVLEYFELCKNFWTGANQHQKLDQWAGEVKKGKIPDFGANLVY
jgi:hypothetical protein